MNDSAHIKIYPNRASSIRVNMNKTSKIGVKIIIWNIDPEVKLLDAALQETPVRNQMNLYEGKQDAGTKTSVCIAGPIK